MKPAYIVFLWSMFSTAAAWGADARSAQVNCDLVKQSALNAQRKYVNTYTPRVNPVQTFDSAVGSCLENIQNFSLGLTLPALGDIEQLLSDMAKKLAQSACQSASSQFNNAVNSATASVNGAASAGTGGMINRPITAGNDGTGISVQGDNGTTVQNVLNRSTGQVVNTFPP